MQPRRRLVSWRILFAILPLAFLGDHPAANVPAGLPSSTPPATVAALLKEGERQLEAGEKKRAREVYEQARGLAQRTGDREGQIDALVGMGDADSLGDDHRPALKALEQALSLASGRKAESVRAHLEIRQGIQTHDQQDVAGAREHYKKALAAARRSGDRRAEARALNVMGNLALAQARNDRVHLQEAHDLYQAALRVAQTIGYQLVIIQSERAFGDIAVASGKTDQGIAHYQKALAATRVASNRDLTEAVLNSIGAVYLDLADYGKASWYCQEALRTGSRDQEEISYALNNLGVIYSQLGSALGKEYFQKALRLAEETGDDYAAMRSLNNLGALLQGAGDLAGAQKNFEQALQRAEKAGDQQAMAGDWYNLGDNELRLGRFGPAEAGFRKSLEISRSRGEARLVAQALGGLADLQLARGERDAAVRTADQATTAALESGNREILWRARTCAGQALRGLKRPAAARQAFEQAIETIEEVRGEVGAGLVSTVYLEGRLLPYQERIDLAAVQGDAAGALTQAERAKGRALLDTLRTGRVDLAAALPPERRETERRLRERLGALNTEVLKARTPTAQADAERRREQARRDLEAFTLNLYASRSDLRLRFADFPTWHASNARALLADGRTAVVEYAVLPGQTWLWTVTADSPGAEPRVRLHRLPVGSDGLKREVEAFRRQLATRDLDFQRRARSLYGLLLAVAEPELRGKSALLLVPDGPLWDLPFQALQPGPSEALLERHAISYAPSLSFAAELAARRSRRPARPPLLLAVGNPTPAHLPEAEREARSVAGFYGPAGVVYTAGQATEERVKTEAGRFRVLHFATHAFLDDQNPFYSHLVLAAGSGSKREDGLLEAWEILNLRLDADLVVLSACQTARGRPAGGEGMLGLTWALAAAGSSTVLASQWEVDSASTRDLMVAFHREWRAGAGKAEALRRAALAVRGREGYRHPFYWAGFVVVGDGG